MGPILGPKIALKTLLELILVDLVFVRSISWSQDGPKTVPRGLSRVAPPPESCYVVCCVAFGVVVLCCVVFSCLVLSCLVLDVTERDEERARERERERKRERKRGRERERERERKRGGEERRERERERKLS